MPSIAFTIAGTVKWTCPANVTTIQVECWGGGYGGQSLAGAGGGGGEYAAESTVAVTPGVTYYGQVGQGGASPSFAAGNTTWNSGQVTAHGASSATGASGSTNSVHHNGGNGGAGGSGTGGGGGGSGAPSGTGNNGASGGSGGAGATALPSGGAGGRGGTSGHSGSAGGPPGGGGGGAGGGSFSPGGGYAGQIRLTYASAPGSAGSYPSLLVPFFPAGYSPGQADLNGWFHDPFSFLETRPVFRARQTTTATTLPSAGTATVIGFDTIDEDPLNGWQAGAFAWGPPAGFSGWYQVLVTLYSAALAAGNTIRPGVTATGSPGAFAGGYPGAAVAGVQGSFWVYLVGGQDTVQATGTLLNAGVNVNTNLTFGAQSSMEVTWLSS